MTRICLGLSRLREHKFSHNFQNCINPLCSCAVDIKSTSHFFIHCPLFDDKTITLLSTLNKIDCKLIETIESFLIKTLLFGNSMFDLRKKIPSFFLNASIDYILSTTRHFSLFKNLNLREKADRNFRRTFLKNRFRHLKLYSNSPS